ncbi:hypothetical protein QEZ54_33175 [Catellatospora sp. KI3]|uniref:hypothetical protein n=1 Tax=Catellatospora sp. KI3 TaxID=3041620 RepID=UPI002482E475|nr:hypothetical protein [Catellatospora sp. KI3]MDI1465836.1 hypothetical protein [Catellatospora sp. KI3]
MTVEAEKSEILDLLGHVEVIEEVANDLAPDDRRRERLLDAVRGVLGHCRPIRVPIAAEMLNLSEPTIRAWARQGVFEVVPLSTVTTLEPVRFHDVLHLVQDLRAAGQTSGLLDTVWRRLEDAALLEREDLREGLDQATSGAGQELGADELEARSRRM